MKIVVKVTPRAKKVSIEHCPDGSLKARLTAPPTDGKANEQLIELLSKDYQVPKSMIRIVRGAGARMKTIMIDNGTDN